VKSTASLIRPAQQRSGKKTADDEYDVGIFGERHRDLFAPLVARARTSKAIVPAYPI
jgi:hypothetical protein